jgi:hypothetical protein
MKADSAAVWLEGVIIDEMLKAIADLDKSRGIVRDATSKEVCKHLLQMMLKPHLRDAERGGELKRAADAGEPRIRELARIMFKKHIAVHFPN